MDFREGGAWLYSMVGPDDARHWCRVDYKTINKLKALHLLMRSVMRMVKSIQIFQSDALEK